MTPHDFEQRINNASLLWQSRMRRWRFTFAALAASHTLSRFTMSASKPPAKETILSRSLMTHIAESMAKGEQGASESHVEHALKNHLSLEDKALCMQIAERGVAMARELGVDTVDLQLAAMDVATVHVVSCPLHLWRFLASDADDFSHDFTGIGRFIDRRSGVLTGGFKPRFAVKKS